jgi:ribonuclease HI
VTIIRPLFPEQVLPDSVMNQRRTIVFTDGASKRNPGPGGWGVIIVRPDSRVTELGGGDPLTTNNKMELTGAIQALATLRGADDAVAIYTDSTYVIQGITGWVHGWRRRGWKTATGSDVLNRELWEELWSLVGARGAKYIDWHYVRGHIGIPGNERVDEIADSFALGKPVSLYDGPLSGYGVQVLQIPDETGVPPRTNLASASGRGSKRAAYSYLSIVDGEPKRHRTWAECEQRVKGRPGARFKKAADAAEEAAILQEWHLTPADVQDDA